MINNFYLKTSNKIIKDFRESRKKFYNILNTEFYDAIFDCNVKELESHYNQLQIYFEESVKLYHILNSEFNQSNINIFTDNYKKCMEYFEEQYDENKEKMESYINDSISKYDPLLKEHIKNMNECLYILDYCEFKKLYIQQYSLYKKSLYDMIFMIYKTRIDLMKEYSKSCEELLKELKRLSELVLKECEKRNENNDNVEADDLKVESNNNVKYKKIFKNKDFQRLLNQKGFEVDRQTGGHKIYKKDSKTVVLPIHSKEMKKGLSLSIQKSINDIENIEE